MKKAIIIFTLLTICNISFGQTKEKEAEQSIQITHDNLDRKLVEELPETKVYNTSAVEVKPEFPGGIEKFHLYSQKKIKIPEEIKTQKIKGKVFVTFVIEKDGSLTDIKVIRDIGYRTKEIVENFLKNSPNWKPGKLNGKTVRCQHTLPIIIDGTK